MKVLDKKYMLIDKDKCYGCSVCKNICPNKCVDMVSDDEGFLYPKINREKCIECSLCHKACPIHNKVPGRLYNKAYAIAANDNIRFNSASGGVFYLIAEYVLSNGGVVCGAKYSDNFLKVYHKVIDSEKDLLPLMSSKYVQSDIKDSFIQIEKLIIENKIALFCGTPCQCAGLRKFLEVRGISDKNIIIIDLLCHAVPSPLVWQLFVEETITNLKEFYKTKIKECSVTSAKIKYINQRSKLNGWQPNILLELELELNDGSVIFHSEFGAKSDDYSWWYPWLRKNAASRRTCYNCTFACKARQGDITLGDFWGVDDIISGINDEKGLSLVFASTKGIGIINKIVEQHNISLFRELNYFEAEQAIAKQKTMNGGWFLPQERQVFFKDLITYGFFSAYKKLLNYIPSPPTHKTRGARETCSYDIGIVGWYYSGNIGDVLTNWAAYRFFELRGLRVLMIADPYIKETEFSPRQKVSFETVKKYYNMSNFRSIEELIEINDICKNFIVAGGVIWSWQFLSRNQGFYDLGFAAQDAVKTSFTPGLFLNSPEEYVKKISETLQSKSKKESIKEIYVPERNNAFAIKRFIKRSLKFLPAPCKKTLKFIYYKTRKIIMVQPRMIDNVIPDENADPMLAIKKCADNFKRFNRIFVRETTGSNIMKKVFDVDATQIYDPVFFIPKETYLPLTLDCTVEIPDHPFIFYYLFEMHFPFIKYYHNIAKQLKLEEIFLVPSRNQSLEDYCKNREYVRNCGFTTAEATIGNWVGLLSKSKYVICNSFHCVVLAIRFNIQFVVLSPRKDENRLDFLKDLGLSEKIIKDDFRDCATIYKTLRQTIDWNNVNDKLNKKCIADRELLLNTLKINNT